VQPLGTEFQIIRSTNSANAAVGTVVWRGIASPVALVSPSSRHWYYVKAAANSAFSPYVPNTFGIGVDGRPEADNTLSANLIPDADIDYSSINGVFWGTDNTEAFSLSMTGGLTGGKITMTGTPNGTANSSLWMFAIPTSPYLRLYDSNVAVGMRYRANSVALVDSGTAAGPVFNIGAWTGVGTPNHSNTVLNTAGLPGVLGSLVVVQLGSYGLGTWVTLTNISSITTRKPTHPSNVNPTSYPYLCAAVGLSVFQAGSSQFEIDRVWFRYL
jgi:hypothetical protein